MPIKCICTCCIRISYRNPLNKLENKPEAKQAETVIRTCNTKHIDVKHLSQKTAFS